jgi:peptide/nickel transport system substrate-binding protein
MIRKKPLSLLALVSILAIVGAACSSNNPPATNTPSGTGSAPAGQHKGGVFRTAVEDFGFTGAFDPTGEYLTTGFALFGQLLLRNLVTYNHVAGLPGDKAVPDLATDTGQVSSDGLTWTFKLKSGLKWGPPVNRAITSKDIAFAFDRIDTKSLVAQYGFYFDGTIQGMNGPVDKQPTSISGIETPDDSTIIFHLTQPTGDLPFRLAMPAAAAMPPEVAGCFSKAGDYGRDVISSGPYMIKGADQVDISSCSTIKPMSGFDPTKFMKIVRNPNYDPTTDSTADRGNYVAGVDIEIDSNTDDIFSKIQTGELDGSIGSTPSTTTLQKYLTDPTLKDRFHVDFADATSYETMNLLTPPFDDVHVRRAMNFALNKEAMHKIAGGDTTGKVATHIFPPTVLPFDPANYDPYPSTGFGGDATKAKAEMKLSKYDTNHDGICDATVCKNVLMISRSTPPRVNYIPIIQESAAAIGITFKPRELDTGTAYQTIQTVKNLIPFSNAAGWAKDYPDPSTFAVLFQSSGINCEGQINYSEVGMTAAQAKSCGVSAAYNAVGGNTMSVDAEVTKCQGDTGDARTACWVQLDKDLMEKVVPWIPYLWPTDENIMASDVEHYEFDQASSVISLAHISVTNNIDPATL